MGLLKKKKTLADGTKVKVPTKFGKAVKGVGKLVAAVAPIVPIPGSSKVGQIINKGVDKLSAKTGGKVNLDSLRPDKSHETLKGLMDKFAVTGGAALAGATDAPKLADNSPLSPVEQGFLSQKIKTYATWAGLGLLVVFILKKLKVF